MASPDTKGTILYIEDNPDNRLLVKRILLAEDYELLEAKDASDALHLLQNSHPDLILMDINMPDMDGYTLTAKIKSLPGFARVPILAVTANVMRGDKEKTLEAGCDGYIQKPLDIDQLTREVERFIMRRTNA
jgi:two-component system cell cycle response regulator DivK